MEKEEKYIRGSLDETKRLDLIKPLNTEKDYRNFQCLFCHYPKVKIEDYYCSHCGTALTRKQK